MVEMANRGRKVRSRALIVMLILSTFLGNCQSILPRRSYTGYKTVAVRPTTIASSHFINHLKVRGGSDEESEEPALEEIEDEATSVLSTVNSLTKRFVVVLGKATVAAVYAGGRAVKAAFQGDDDVEEDEEEEPPSFMTKTMRTVKRMWTAAWNPPDSGEEFTADLASAVQEKEQEERI